MDEKTSQSAESLQSNKEEKEIRDGGHENWSNSRWYLMYVLKEEDEEGCVLRTALLYQCTATNQNIILSHDLLGTW